MLALLVAVAIVVFALVSELSRVSQLGLDEAMVRDNGLRGSYQISINADAKLTDAQTRAAAEQVAGDLEMSIWGSFEDLPAVPSECPPFEQVGEQSLRVLWKQPGVPFELPYGQIPGIETKWCIEGQTIPAQALFSANETDRSIYGERLYIHPDYKKLVLLSTLEPLDRGHIIVSGIDRDQSALVRDAMISALTADATLLGTDLEPAIVVNRIDQAGQGVREAARGVGITYGVIGWGVLILAALAVMVIQTTHLRQRLWFFGLMRSLGATGRRIGAVLLIDTTVVVLAGTAVALGMLTLSQQVISDFAATAFGVDANVLSTDLLPPLVLGLAGILVVATAIPLAVALLRDPLDVLEAPRD